jgi:hypothetical protein
MMPLAAEIAAHFHYAITLLIFHFYFFSLLHYSLIFRPPFRHYAAADFHCAFRLLSEADYSTPMSQPFPLRRYFRRFSPLPVFITPFLSFDDADFRRRHFSP